MKSNYDVVVIGAGSGGLTAAVGLAKVGKSVLLIEREHIGGECTNSGCIPSKSLLHHAKSYRNAVAISGSNGNTENYRREAFSYVQNKIKETLAEETIEHFERMGINVVIGEAKFTNKSTISINQNIICFKKAIIATGSRPLIIEIPGLDNAKILTNQNLFNLPSIPKRTLIIGAGAIGLEMGQALAMLGSHVTILNKGPVFAKLEDESIQPIIYKACLDLGIEVIQEATMVRAEGNEAIILQENTTGEKRIAFDVVLMAIGRLPNLPQGLDTAGVYSTDRGITTNKQYQTNNRHIYALGDVADTLKFTHQADHVARGIVTKIATKGIIGQKINAVPKVTYTKPELAQVGLSQSEAELDYGKNNIYRIEVPLSLNDRARTDNAQNGILVVIVTRLSGKILGAHIAGSRAGELIALFTLAIDQKLSLWKMRRTIYAYPTYSLIVKKAGDIFFATQIKNLRGDVWSAAKKILPKLIIAIIWLSTLYYLWQLKVASGLSFSQLSQMIFNFITGTMWGPLLFILIYAVRPLIFFPASALTILAGIFFGLWGFVYTMIGANLSAMLAHFVGQYFSVSPKKLPQIIQNISGPIRTHPFMTILTMHLTFMPFDAVNYAAGIFRAPFFKHAAATFLGTILGSFTFVSIGASLDVEEYMKNGITVDAINGLFVLLSVGIFIASLLLSKYLKKRNP